MTATPTKVANLSTSIYQTVTPVRFLHSPKSSSPPDDNSNIVVCKSRLELIIKTLTSNYDKWKIAQIRGLALCNSIEAIKTRCLEKPADTLYPKELQLYCDKLALIASIFVDITSNAREAFKQLSALGKLPDIESQVIYSSWTMTQFKEYVEELLSCYEQETQKKLFVMHQLAHCSSRAELIRLTSSWEYPQYVNEWVELMFAFISQEINLYKK